MAGFWNRSKHWAKRAAEARVIAEQVADAVSRETMLRIAKEFDELATMAREAELQQLPRYFYRDR